MRIGIIGAGKVGRALGGAWSADGHEVTYGVRRTDDPRHADLAGIAEMPEAAAGADVVVIALPWLWQGRVRAYQAWSMGILLYLCEGVVRGMSDPGAGRALGWIETALACLAFGAILAYVRARRAPRA